MAFGSFQSSAGGRDQAMSEINMVPLIDIVLVLLVLFILAAPMAAQSVLVSLPRTAALAPQEPVESLNLSLRDDGVLLNEDGVVLDDSSLSSLLAATAAQDAVPVVRIWSDENVRYAFLAEVIVNVRNAGLTKISLMTRSSGSPGKSEPIGEAVRTGPSVP